MKKTFSVPALALAVILVTVSSLQAQVPNLINYQGRVVVGTTNFNGSGQFKFALVDTTGANTYWSNDGTSNAGSPPAAAVLLTVTNGLYSVLLGDTTLTNMTAVPASVFTNTDVRLRVWFNDGTHGFQLLTPDQRIAAVGYALQAGTMSGLSNVSGQIGIGTTNPQAQLDVAGAIRLGNGTGTASAGMVQWTGSDLQGFDGARWRSLLAVDVSVKDFGAKGDGVTDDTSAIQAAINYSSTSAAAVIVPTGTYLVTSLTIKNHMVLIGESESGSIIQAAASVSPGLFVLDTGPVVRVKMENLMLQGGSSTPVNLSQWAIYAAATPDSSSTGGLWNSEFRNIRIQDFTNGMWFIGGGSNELTPNQFIKFDQVGIYRTNDTGVAFKATGQNGQFTHVGCVYQAPAGTTTGTNIQLDLNTSLAPSSNIFVECTSQNAQTAVEITNGSNLTFLNCWFEGIAQSFTVSGSSEAILIQNCRFANAANGGGTGYVLSSTSSNCSFRDNYILGTTDKVIVESGTADYVKADNNFIANPPTVLTSGSTKQVAVSGAGALTLNNGKTFIVNTSATNITTITSNLLVGESVYLSAFSGPIQLATGGNISVGSGTSPLTIPQNQVVELVRYDLNGTWKVVGK